MADRWWVYIIECTARTGRVTVHVGIALDVQRRIGEHAAGKVAATHGRDVALCGSTGPMPQGDALRMEVKLKKLDPWQKRLHAWSWGKRKRYDLLITQDAKSAQGAQNWQAIVALVHELDHRHKPGDTQRMADDDVLDLVAGVLRRAAAVSTKLSNGRYTTRFAEELKGNNRVVLNVPLSPEDRVRLAHAETLTLDVTDLLP